MSTKRNNNNNTAMEVHRVFREFADGTSMHGVPRIINARSVSARIFWSIICMCAFGMFLWQTAILLERYYSYPKKVNVEIIQRPVPFPSVTVCNADHLDLMIVARLETLLLEDYNETKPTDDATYLAFQEKYEEFWDYSSFFFPQYLVYTPLDKAKEDMPEVYSRLGLTANMGPELASKGGVKLNDFIVSCRFMDDVCNISKVFIKMFDPYYYNCFTFNPNAFANTQATRLQGVEHGLSLLLFTGSAGQFLTTSEYDYMIPGMEESDSALTSGRGARVVVHAADTKPHPTAEGYDIPPGFSVTIGVKARENVRIHGPHGNCSYGQENSTFKYTLIRCQNDCLQRNIIDKCRCVDNRISVQRENDAIPYCIQLPQVDYACYENFSESCVDIIKHWNNVMDCRREVYDNMTIRDPEAFDHCHCYPPCNDMVYDVLYSLSTLPEKTEEHTAFYSTFDNFLAETLSPEKRNLLNKKHAGKNPTTLSSYISRLNVHIADNNVIKTSESPDYEAIRLISDIGGQLGLWIGISVMTLFEVLQLVADVLRFLTAKGRNISERRPDRVADRDMEVRCEIDKLTTV